MEGSTEKLRAPDKSKIQERTLEIPRMVLLGGVIIAGWALIALLAPLIAPLDPTATDLGATLAPPFTRDHLLGTDHLGRDIFSQIIYGSRLNLSMGLIGVLSPFLLGILIGVISGYFGGLVDTLLMRLLDISLAFPFIVLVLAIVAVLGPGLQNYYIALAIVAWVPYARLVRAEALVLTNAEFIDAARVLGFGDFHILMRHILPNAVTPAIVFLMTDIVLTILLGSGLSFFGLGAQPPTPEWGRMIAEGQTFMRSAWWISVFPGIAIIMLSLGFSMMGDGLAEHLKVRA